MEKLNKLFKYSLYVLPVALFFSYEPVMHFGSDASMNFELSIPLVWLVLFDTLVFLMFVKEKNFFSGLRRKWMWLLFPVWLSLSILWSLNFVRGMLTVGIMWLLYFAGYGIWSFRKLLDKEFWRVFLRWFFGASLVICAWCLLQCILDLIGVSREMSLICAGCTYHMFGFPHPDGFAIEPQFMGNLLLAPTLVAAWLLVKKQDSKNLERERSRGDSFYNRSVGVRTKLQFRDSLRDCCKNHAGSRFLGSKFLLFCFFTNMFTLFLTFSRGAIYAFVVGLLVMSVWVLVEVKAKWKKDILKRVGLIWGVVVLSFGVALGTQGLMAELSPTNDTFKTGVSKVLNHLSLGVIEVDGNSPVKDTSTEAEVVENSVEKNGEKLEDEQAIFDGYVRESTETRLRLSGAAMNIWSKDFVTVLFGVGLGGAGQALYVNNLSPAPKEIVQNQYVSLLLETGIVGISLFLLTLVLIVRTVMKYDTRVMIISLLVAFGVSLCFFSGLPNALHIYLLPMVLLFLLW
ncbi:O-antigen ligase family protein [Candidatus Saccharibacteria bacterium]|nr:O-antigen ligase family protein [Candidatus Saccharibacteria bacterium]